MANFVTTSASNEGFVDALVDLAEEKGNASYILQLRDQARAKLLGGGGQVSVITSASVNGKTVGQSVLMDAKDLLVSCQRALRRYRGSEITVTHVDFSELS